MSLNLKVIYVFVITACAYSYALNDGRYYPLRAKTITGQPNYALDGRSIPKRNDGRYYPGNEGKYQGLNDGKYHPNDAGTYKGNNGRYVHRNYNDSGKYREGDSKSGKPESVNEQPRNQKDLKEGRNTTGPMTFQRTNGVGNQIGQGLPKPKYNWRILYLYDQEDKDGYHYIYETENGIKAEEEGHIVELSTGEGLRSTGFFEYTGNDGVLYRVDYVADDKGFMPRGAHLPQTPKYVKKLLEYLALNENKVNIKLENP